MSVHFSHFSMSFYYFWGLFGYRGVPRRYISMMFALLFFSNSSSIDFHRFVMSFRRLLASKFEPMAQFISTWLAFWVHMAPTWTPELAKVAIPHESGIEITETHFSKTSLEKHRLQAQSRCPNHLQGGIGEDKGRSRCSQRHSSASTCCKSYAFVWEWC